MHCSPPGSSVHGILQTRILEWVAMPSSRGSSQPRDWTQVSHIAGRFFTVWATQEALFSSLVTIKSLNNCHRCLSHDYKIFQIDLTALQFSSVQSLSHDRPFVTPRITAHQASLSITNSRSLLKLMSIELVMPSSHLILRHPLLLLPPIPPSIRVFSNESTLRMR